MERHEEPEIKGKTNLTALTGMAHKCTQKWNNKSS